MWNYSRHATHPRSSGANKILVMDDTSVAGTRRVLLVCSALGPRNLAPRTGCIRKRHRDDGLLSVFETRLYRKAKAAAVVRVNEEGELFNGDGISRQYPMYDGR